MARDPINKVLLIVWFSMLAFVVIYKAIYIPITYDESASSIFYPAMTVKGIMRNDGGSWPNNHILNTLLIKLSENMFGIKPWSVRLPNVLSFFLLLASVGAVAVRFFRSSWLLFCLLPVVLLANPYLVDFYSLARGYGMSNALMVASVAGLLLYIQTNKPGWVLLSALMAALAVYANFTLFIYWAAWHVIVIPIWLVRTGISIRLLYFIGAIIVCDLVLISLSWQPVADMNRMHRMIYFSDISFFHDTVADQAARLLYGRLVWGLSERTLGYGFLLVVLLAVGRSIFKLRKNVLAFAFDPLVALTLLLLLVWGINMLQKVLFHTPYLNNRTALSYYVLWAIVFCFLLRDLWLRAYMGRHVVAFCILAFFLCNFFKAVNLRSVYEWNFDAYTYEVTDYLREYKATHPDVGHIEMDASWIFLPSFSFYHDTGYTPWLVPVPEHREVDTASRSLFYYATGEDAAQLKNYTVVRRLPPSDQVLLMHK